VTTDWNWSSDALLTECLLLRQDINEDFVEAKLQVARWEPAPMPEGWDG
jgi:hypothetical protein